MRDAIRILAGSDVHTLLQDREAEILDCVREAYRTFGTGQACLPHSSFLRFNSDPRDRIIALPAYLGGSFETAGLKWISSVPANHDRRIDRASGIVALNDLATGRVTAILEASIISAKRTAASAALAARTLCAKLAPLQVGLIGLGRINFEVLRFLRSVFPTIQTVHAYDSDPSRYAQFSAALAQWNSTPRLLQSSNPQATLSASSLTSFATTAVTPHIESLSEVASDAVILHLSLRDLSVDAILAANNVVDDVDHVCRANTSVHLASEHVGHREFLTPLINILEVPRERWAKPAPVIFSPFGLGVLDVAVGSLALRLARESRIGTIVEDFHPELWTGRS